MFVLYQIHWKRHHHDFSRGCNNLMLGHQCFHVHWKQRIWSQKGVSNCTVSSSFTHFFGEWPFKKRLFSDKFRNWCYYDNRFAMTKVLKNGVHEDANPINTHHDNPEEKQCTKFFTESDIVSRLTPHCKATKKRNRGALKGKGGGEKTIDRTEKHRPQPKKQAKILNKNVTRDITISSQISPDRRIFTLTPMLSSSPKCEEERFGDRNDHGEKAVNRKKNRKPIRPLSSNWISNL